MTNGLKTCKSWHSAGLQKYMKWKSTNWGHVVRHVLCLLANWCCGCVNISKIWVVKLQTYLWFDVLSAKFDGAWHVKHLTWCLSITWSTFWTDPRTAEEQKKNTFQWNVLPLEKGSLYFIWPNLAPKYTLPKPLIDKVTTNPNLTSRTIYFPEWAIIVRLYTCKLQPAEMSHFHCHQQ